MYKPHVRFVVMRDPEYGLLVTMQMISHAGRRDGKEADAFVLNSQDSAFFSSLEPHFKLLANWTSLGVAPGREASKTEMEWSTSGVLR